jgi:phosphohistidine phosphatase
MELHFLRHGPAGSSAAWDGDDKDRPLTNSGRDLTERVAARLAEAGIRVDLIVASPYARAAQTAEIARRVLGAGAEVEHTDLLRPGFDLPALEQILAAHPDVARLMLVGHEGDFSSVIGQLIGSAELVLKKSGVAMVELPDPGAPHGTLRWLVPPGLIT